MQPRYLPRGIDFHGVGETVRQPQSTEETGSFNVCFSPQCNFVLAGKHEQWSKTAKHKIENGLFKLMIQSEELYCHSKSYNHLVDTSSKTDPFPMITSLRKIYQPAEGAQGDKLTRTHFQPFRELFRSSAGCR